MNDQHRRQESNLRASGSEPDATTNSCYSGVFVCLFSPGGRSRTFIPLLQRQLAYRWPTPVNYYSRQSAMSESNRPDRIGSPGHRQAWMLGGRFAARPMAHISFTRRKERELNSQGFNARSASNEVPSPIGLPFHIKSSGSRNRTCVWAINSRLPVPTQDPPE